MLQQCITYRDLEFDHAFRWHRQHDGRTVRRWVPIGMPRLSHGMERCVFFAFRKNYMADEPEFIGPCGTGFFVCRQSEATPYTWHFYAVTNAHVARGFPCIRINDTDTTTQYWDREPDDWTYSAMDDLAALDITDEIEFSEDRGVYNSPVSWINEKHFVSEWFRNGYNVGIGDQTVMLGLLAHHNGGKINLPVGRFGNIAAVPSDLMPVRLAPTDEFVRPAWLNDCRSRYGFSGSPVWVWRSQYDNMNLYRGPGLPDNFHTPEDPHSQSFLALMGCHRGQFREEAKIYAANESDEARRPLQTGDNIEIASSMTVVIPAWEISNVLNHLDLKKQAEERDARPERRRYSNAAQKIMRAQEQAGMFPRPFR